MRPLTIGIFMEHYEPFVSGVITSVNGLMAELQSRGHTVYIICPKVKGHIDTNSRVIRIPSISAKAFDNATIGYPTPRVIKRLMSIKFDIIHSHDIFYTAGVGLIIARRQKIPYIQTYHTLWHRFIEQFPLGFGFRLGSVMAMSASYPVFFGFKTTADFLMNYSAIEQSPNRLSKLAWGHMVNMSRQADAVVVPSAHLQADLRLSGLKGDIQQIPNGIMPVVIDIDDILPPKDVGRLRIISVARFSQEKRLETLVKSIAKLKIDVELVMAGDGPFKPDIEALAIKLGVASKIRFMGNLSNGAVRKLMRECDVLALASYNFDNQPMVILEAIEAGLPVVYCDPNLSEGLSAANSVLATNSPAGFATALASLSSHKKRAKMSSASRHMSGEFSIDIIADQVLNIYNQSLSQRSLAA